MAILDEPLERGTRIGVLERLKIALSELRPSERRVADKILQDPGQAVALSINEFALICDVSQPTISRFCRKLGFSGYAALRISITNDLASSSTDTNVFSTPLGTTNFADLVGSFRRMSATQVSAQAMRTAHRVEIWPAADLAWVGFQLADRLAALAVPVVCSMQPTTWQNRARNLPPKSVVLMLTQTAVNPEMEVAFSLARKAQAQVLCCVAQSASSFAHMADWLIPLPHSATINLTELALVEALVTEVHDSFHLVLPDGAASPWIPWRHVQKVFFPAEDEPIPALLLTREEPPQPRPLVLFFGSFRMTKEDSLPGFGEHFIGRAFVAAFLNAGYHVLIVDARAHGERKRAWERTDTLVRSSLQGLGKDELAGAISDASAIIDGIRSLSLYDESTRIGIVGTSWGGLQAMLTFSGDARIHCAVGVLPFMYLPRLEDFADLAHEPRVRLREPENWDGSLFAPRPIQLIVGEEDPLVDPQHIQQFIDVLRPAYTAASADDALQTVLLPGLGHTWDQREIDTTLDWLQRFLNP